MCVIGIENEFFNNFSIKKHEIFRYKFNEVCVKPVHLKLQNIPERN